jgi:hypothetical protein
MHVCHRIVLDTVETWGEMLLKYFRGLESELFLFDGGMRQLGGHWAG